MPGRFDKRFSRRQMVAPVPFLLAWPQLVGAQAMVFDSFDGTPESRWEFLSDQVMGGVSTGQLRFARGGDGVFARLTGQVSTENRGGFIQFRRAISPALPSGLQGVRLITRGNGQRYFVHLRSTGTVLPWQYYQAGFETGPSWAEVRLPFAAFNRSGRMLRSVPQAGSLTSIGIVAYGRDHNAQVDVREVGFF